MHGLYTGHISGMLSLLAEEADRCKEHTVDRYGTTVVLRLNAYVFIYCT
jgi:hypothetical protein